MLDNGLNFVKVIGQGSGNNRLINPDGIAVVGDQSVILVVIR